MAKKTAKKTSKKASSGTAKKTPQKAAAEQTAQKAVAGTPKKTPSPSARKKPTQTPAPGRGKPALKKAEIEKFRQMLLAKRRALLGDMSGIEAETLGSGRQSGSGELSNMPTHLADLGTDNYEHEFSLGLLESERALLTEINEALERINAGSYGVCLGTGEPIGKTRLQARPWAKYCIEYARKVEQGLVQPGDEGEELGQ